MFYCHMGFTNGCPVTISNLSYSSGETTRTWEYRHVHPDCCWLLLAVNLILTRYQASWIIGSHDQPLSTTIDVTLIIHHRLITISQHQPVSTNISPCCHHQSTLVHNLLNPIASESTVINTHMPSILHWLAVGKPFTIHWLAMIKLHELQTIKPLFMILYFCCRHIMDWAD